MEQSPVHDRPIRIEELTKNGLWMRRLTWFVRCVATFMLLKGVYHWSLLCGVADGVGVRFEVMPPAWQLATIFFAIIDVVAGVGLWLLSAWGAAVWLIGAATQIVIDVWFPEVYGLLPLFTLLYAALIVAYVWLRILALREKL